MPLFCCEQCGCVENTASSNFWIRKSRNLTALCAECDPDIGKWHDYFTKRPAEGMLIDQNGFLWSKDGIASLPAHYSIVGEAGKLPLKDG